MVIFFIYIHFPFLSDLLRGLKKTSYIEKEKEHEKKKEKEKEDRGNEQMNKGPREKGGRDGKEE